MKARKKGEDLPTYSRAVVELAEERLLDCDPETHNGFEIYIALEGLKIPFRRVPTTMKSATDGETFWRWELVGNVEEPKP